MIDIDRLYFEWLYQQLESDAEDQNIGLGKLCWVLFHISFVRRVGLDVNLAIDGLKLRRRFLEEYGEVPIEPTITNPFLLEDDCSWLEALLILSEKLDFLYDGGVRGRFIEMLSNAGLDPILLSWGDDPTDNEVYFVESIMSMINHSQFDPKGVGGLFPLVKSEHPDQRRVEIWSQQAAYFGEKLEGILWTSTN